mmetsp:Transcript_238/g.806  ORF Transcript_238/g.806 Transcript_238/m.806 type:complete len:480 (+) Transcript_238:93-1532(+)
MRSGISAPVSVSQAEGQDQRREQLLSGAVFTRAAPSLGQVPRAVSYHTATIRAPVEHQLFGLGGVAQPQAVYASTCEYAAEDGGFAQPQLLHAPRAATSTVNAAPAPAGRRPLGAPLQPTILAHPVQVLPASIESRNPSRQLARPVAQQEPTLRQPMSHTDTKVTSRATLSSKPTEETPSGLTSERSCPHVLYVNLAGLDFHQKLPAALEGAWYESVKCFVSIHPAADERKVGELPRDVPEETKHGEHAVSKMFPLLVVDQGSSDRGPVARAHLLESLALKLPLLPPCAVAYLWARKASLFNHETFLIGSCLMPINDESLRHGQPVQLRVFDAGSWEDIADLHLSFDFAHVPGEIQLPVLEKVRATHVTVHWHPPLRNGGAPLMGYQVERIVGKTDASEDKVEVLEACHKATSYTFNELSSQCTYKVRIAAVNDAGAGEMRVIEFSTAASPGHAQSEEAAGEDSEESPGSKVNAFPMRV